MIQAEALRSLAVSITSVHPDPSNVRRHSPRNLEAIKASLVRYGQRKPIVVNRSTGIIEAGNATWDAAKALGWTEIAVVYVDDDPTTAAGYAIADNRTAELAEWDDGALARTLQSLKADGELLNAGFDDQELDALLRSLNPPALETFNLADAMNAAPELATKVERGQVWRLGKHRMMCGDSTKDEDLDTLMVDRRADVVFTDPPYGVLYGGRSGKSIAGDLTYSAIPLMFSHMDRILNARGWCYVCGGWTNIALYVQMFERYFKALPQVIVWDKGRFTMRHNGYHSGYELLFFSFREGGGARWYGPRDGEGATDIWRVKLEEERTHLTQKPIELARRALENSCPPGGVVCDPFLGTGSTLIAADQLGRVCYGMEIEPRYCAVSIARWESYTGQSAVLLEEVAA